MNTNLVSLVTQFLTPDVIARISSALGIDKTQIGKALTAAVPGILASLTGVASTPDGSRRLFDAVSQQPGGLNMIADMIGGSGQKNLIESGSGMLSSLLGGSSASALETAVGKFAGLGSGTGGALLGLLTPIVMGVLGQQKNASGLDSSGLSQLLTSQKADIARALPSGFSDLLSGTGLLSGLGAAAGQAAKTAARPMSYETVDRTIKRPAASGTPAWAWALPAIALLALGWWYFSRPTTEVAQQTRTTQTAQIPTTTQSVTPPSLIVGSVDLGSTVQTTVGTLRQTLAGMTDVDSARLALPKLQDAATQLDRVNNLAIQLPAGSKAAFVTVIVNNRPQLDELFNRVLATPGVAEVAKPTIDSLRLKLDGLAKTAG
ncbi:DUF937 domain-containing protein [Microvirga flavescens]|uniref:DUF937 domain-containing protein n=1 Tax=Microvirga flavescens TaxID=2249811 RepID=UPI000DDA8CFD|nr:DUF937 domain-containing protein [Microvirga flavescens]